MSKAGGDNKDHANGTTGIVAVRADGAPAREVSSSPRAGARIDVPPQREWLTAVEADTEALPGCPGERTLRNAMRDQLMASRKRAGRGGGREFHWTSLPDQARAEYLKRYGVATIENDRAQDSKSRGAQRDLQAEARHLIVQASASFIADFKMPVGKGLKNFCAAYARKRTKLDAWVYGFEPILTPLKIRTWERIVRTKGASALADKRGRPTGTGLIDGDDQLRAFIVSQYAARPQLTAGQLCDAVRTDLGREIAKRTMQGFIARLRADHAPTLKALTNPDKHRSHHKPAFGSLSAAVQRINQRWELDATRADAMCLMPDGSQRRVALTGLIDVFTRRAIVLVSSQPAAIATQALLRRAIISWGLPEVLKTDNGKEFVNRDVMRFCGDLGIEVQLSRVFTPEEKGHIERFFGTLNRGLFPMLPGFVGHNINDRKAIESRASFAHRFGENGQLVFETSLSPAQLQARIDSWLSDKYEQEIHSGIQQAPASKAVACADQVRRIADERALDGLLLAAPGGSGIRNINKKGIRIENRWYIAGELGGMMGQRVHVSFDPEDLRHIIIYTHDRKAFICLAEWEQALPNDRVMEIARTAQAVQRRGLRVIRNAVLETQARFPAAGLADRILGDAQGDGFVLQDDARKAMHTAARPQLVAAREALDALGQAKAGPQAQEPTQQQRDGAAEYADMTEGLPSAPGLVECDGYQRPAFDTDLDFWTWAQARLAAGLALDKGDAEFHADLQSSHAFQQLLNAQGRA